MERIVSVTTSGGDSLLFRSLYGQESLSALFEFDVELLSESLALDMKKLLGQSLTLEIELLSGGKRYLNGQVTRCMMTGKDASTGRYYAYRTTVRCWLWYLTQTTDSKIFQQKTVPNVIREVLADYAFPVEYKLAASYRSWEYCVQYQESDFAFISRLMEHEGIYYWFRHEDGKHTLVLSDDNVQHDTLPGAATIPYYGADRTSVPQEEYLARWEPVEQITPGGFATVDYNFQKPSASLDVKRENPGDYQHGDLEVYEWMGGYTDPDQGERYSRVRLEALQAPQAEVRGGGNVRELAPGYLFTLRNHPRQAENREYLIVQTVYRVREGGYASSGDVVPLDPDGTQAPGAQQDGSRFDIEIVVLPSSTQFRAARVTPVPHTHGPQTARVVGKSGEQIWTDQYGRIKVQFHWDRYGKHNENSSCWVRVSSPWAGGGFGGIQLPRVNDEVIVDFIGGQPDRPIVVGRVYNADNMPPWDLPGNATQSGFLSRSKDGNPQTASALMFEDANGCERVWMHAERNLDTEVECDETHTVDGSRTTTIGGNDTLHVKGKRTTTVDKHEKETFNAGAERIVTGEVLETVKGNETRSFTGDVTETIKGNVKETITGNLTQSTTGDVTRTITGPVTDTTTGAVKETITGNVTQTTTGTVTRTITGNVTDTITGVVNETITGNSTETRNGTYTQTVTGAVTINANTSMTVNTPHWSVTNSASSSFWSGNSAHGTPARFVFVGASADVWGVRQQVYVGINSQWSTLKLDFAALKNDDHGIKSGSAGVQLKATGAAIVSGGVGVFNRVVSLFT